MSKATLNHPTKEANQQYDCEHIPVRVYEDSSLACQKIGDEIIDQINQKGANKRFVLGLATGSTPIKIYQHLIQAYQEGKVSFANVHSFNLDEYFPMDPKSIHSYVEFMHKNFFDHIDMPKENIHNYSIIPDS